MTDNPAYGADEKNEAPEDLPDDVREEMGDDAAEPVELDEDVEVADEVPGEGEDAGDVYEDGPPPMPEMEMAHCAFCGEPHPFGASRCRACGGFLPIIEETAHKEHFFFLFCSLSLFIGTLLNWEAKIYLPGSYSILGGLLLAVSGYAIFASLVNIWHRRMIVWPHLLAMVLGLWAGWQRVIQLIKASNLESPGGDFAKVKVYVDQFLHLFGPGLYLVVPMSTFMLIFLIVSIFVAGRRDSQRKAAARVERTTRGAGRRR
jgi:uncharacterized membrane protein